MENSIESPAAKCLGQLLENLVDYSNNPVLEAKDLRIITDCVLDVLKFMDSQPLISYDVQVGDKFTACIDGNVIGGYIAELKKLCFKCILSNGAQIYLPYSPEFLKRVKFIKDRSEL